MSLAKRDMGLLQQASLELHEERDLEVFREAAPAIFLKAIPADYFGWFEFGFSGMAPSMKQVELCESEPRFTPKLLKRIVPMVEQIPFTIHARKTGDWGPHRLSDFWSDRQVLSSALYREIYQHVGIGRLIVCATFRGNRVGTLNISRPMKSRDFSDRNRVMLGLLAPHFLQALRAAERITTQREAGSQPLPSLGLTKREIEVALWVERGRTNPEIASILATTARTVEKHVERILVKLGVENRTAAARLIAGTASFSPGPAPGPEKKRAR